MPFPRRCLVILTSILLLAACAGQDRSPAAQQPSAAAPSSPAPASTGPSAWCLDLGTLQFAITHYRVEVGQAIEGAPLDLEELRRQADNIAWLSKPMRADTPADIRDELFAVLDAIAASAAKLTAGGSAAELVDLMYGKEIRPAFDAVGEYDCPE